MVCCKSFGKLHYLFLGLAAGCSVVAMLLLVIYFGTWVNTNVQGYEQYYMGRQGQIGQLALLLAAVPILCLAFLAVGVVFFICCCDKCCCKVIAWIFSMIGCALFLIIILGEIIMVKFSEYGSDETTANKKGYDKTDDKDFLNYRDKAEQSRFKYNGDDGPEDQVYYEKATLTGILQGHRVAVCYFESQDKLNNWEAADCVGRWSGAKMKSYVEKSQKMTADEAKKLAEYTAKGDMDGYQQYRTKKRIHDGCFSLETVQFVTSIALGLSLAAVVCGVIWVFMRCCCVKSD